MLALQNISFIAQAGDSEEKEIIKDVNLTVEDGKLVVITGPNGSGKSTLAKVIMGILKPTKGRILFNGEDITGLGITERAKKGIGFALQSPVRFKGLFVKDLLRLAAGRELNAEACKFLSEVGLCAADYIAREVNGSLSGGELKRIEIATLIARGTKLSVFDEPEAGIDLWSFQSLIRCFENVRKNGSVVIISHQERILEVADKIALLSNGTIADEGNREEMMPKIFDCRGTCEFFR